MLTIQNYVRAASLEEVQEEASGFVAFIADQGADQCGFCNPRLCDEHHRPAA